MKNKINGIFGISLLKQTQGKIKRKKPLGVCAWQL